MKAEISITIAGILGPLLMILISSEYLNFGIWKKVEPTLVYLNGLVLLAAGLVIVRFHNLWVVDWPLLITVLGWALLVAGAFRMYFPLAKQLSKNRLTDLFLGILFLAGCFLTFKGYF